MLFYCPEMEDLAKRIAAENDSHITLGEIKWEKFKVRVLFLLEHVSMFPALG